MINPQWLRSFATLAAEGTFTRSAERLNLTQAAVSQHIKHLENQLGPLLVRHPRRVELTPAGLALLDYHQAMVQADALLAHRLADDPATSGELTLISPGSIGLYLYPKLLDWQQQHPGCHIHYRFAPDTDVLAAVLDNRFELGLVTQKPDSPQIAARLFAEEPLELVLPKGVTVSDWQELKALGFIDHPDGKAMATRLLARAFPGSPGPAALPCHGFINQISLILEPVARGLGFTVLPRFARQAFPRQEHIQVMPLSAQVTDKLWLIHRAQWPLSKRAQQVLAALGLPLAAHQDAP